MTIYINTYTYVNSVDDTDFCEGIPEAFTSMQRAERAGNAWLRQNTPIGTFYPSGYFTSEVELDLTNKE